MERWIVLGTVSLLGIGFALMARHYDKKSAQDKDRHRRFLQTVVTGQTVHFVSDNVLYRIRLPQIDATGRFRARIKNKKDGKIHAYLIKLEAIRVPRRFC